MGDISKLDAVNHMLLMAGESLVSDLDDNSGLDTETALFCLEQFTKDFQLRGIANNQQIMINRIITYIDGNNYYGEEYHNFKNESVKATKWWNGRFFKDKNDVNENHNYTKLVSQYNMKEKQIYFSESI